MNEEEVMSVKEIVRGVIDMITDWVLIGLGLWLFDDAVRHARWGWALIIGAAAYHLLQEELWKW